MKNHRGCCYQQLQHSKKNSNSSFNWNVHGEYSDSLSIDQSIIHSIIIVLTVLVVVVVVVVIVLNFPFISDDINIKCI